MNVLLAEAENPYDDGALVEMDDINHDLAQTDVVLVVGRQRRRQSRGAADKSSPIFGMPIIDADKARRASRSSDR